MKNKLKHYLLFFLTLSPLFAFSQRQNLSSKKWHIGASGGLTFKGYDAEIAVGLHDTYRAQQWGRIALEYLSTELPGRDIENFNRNINFPIKAYTLNATYNRTVISIPNQHQMYNTHSYLFFDIGAGGVIGYETINDGNYTLETGETVLDRSKMIYGAVIRADLEFFFDIPNISMFIAAQQKYLINSDIGKGRFSLNFGVRYWLNY